MRVALVNPPWSFERGISLGCREPLAKKRHSRGRPHVLLAQSDHLSDLEDEEPMPPAGSEASCRAA